MKKDAGLAERLIDADAVVNWENYNALFAA
jgi:hypothetical protein